MVAGRHPIDPMKLAEDCPSCGIRINYRIARPAASGLSRCPACGKLGYFERFLQFEVTAKIRKFTHKEGISTWLKKKKASGQFRLNKFVISAEK